MTIQEIAANIEARHDADCQSYDACGCFNRLLAAVRGEPDPEGEGYRWPIYKYTVAEPPQFGPETPMDYAMRQFRQQMADALFAAVDRGDKSLDGLSSILDDSITIIGWNGVADA
jgi:hypothetical protein